MAQNMPSNFTGRIGCFKAPNYFIISPISSRELKDFRKELKCNLLNWKKPTRRLKKDTYVAVYYPIMKTWERALVREAVVEAAQIKHRVFLVDRGCYLLESDVRLVPAQFFDRLPFTAVHVKIDGIKPVRRVFSPGAPSPVLEEAQMWPPEASTWCRSIVRKTVEVHVKRVDGDGVFHGDLLVVGEGYMWFVGERLCQNMWATLDKQSTIVSSDIDADDGNLSDSSCDSFYSACSNTKVLNENDSSSYSDLSQLCSNSPANQTMASSDSSVSCSPLKSSRSPFSNYLNSSGKSNSLHIRTDTLSGISDNAISRKEVLSEKGKSSNLIIKRNAKESQANAFNCATTGVADKSAVLSDKRTFLSTQLSQIVTRSNIGKINRYDELLDVPFVGGIHAMLRERKYSHLKPVQRYCFSAIMKGHNTVMVSERITGKTMGYILPLMNNLALRANTNPVTVVVCLKTVLGDSSLLGLHHLLTYLHH